MTDTIRSAAREGRIHGAYKTPEGYWLLPVPSFEAWLAEHAEQKRGRPRKEISKYGVWILSIPTVFAGEYIRFYVNQTEADQLDAYTVEVWRRIISGEFYLVKRDSTGIVVGAFGPLDVREEFVNLPGVIDWSLDLAHTLWLDKALGSYEDVTIVG